MNTTTTTTNDTNTRLLEATYLALDWMLFPHMRIDSELTEFYGIDNITSWTDLDNEEMTLELAAIPFSRTDRDYMFWAFTEQDTDTLDIGMAESILRMN